MVENLQREFNHLVVSDYSNPNRNIKLRPALGDADPVVTEFIGLYPDILPTGFDPAEWTMFPASDLAQHQHLKYFDRPVRELEGDALSVWETSLEVVNSLLLPSVRPPMPSVEDLKAVSFQRNRFGGFEYWQQGFKTRGEAHEVAYGDAVGALTALFSGDKVDPHCVRLGGRGKLAKVRREVAEQQELAKGRLILMTSQRDFLLCGVTEQILTELAKDEDCPIWIGKPFLFGGATRFCNLLRPFKKYYCFDAKKFDSSIDPYMVVGAVNVLRNWFSNGADPKYDEYWNFVIESLLHSPIVRDDGIMFRKFVGTTSGHNHNTLVQSVITLTLGYGVVWRRHPEWTPEELVKNCLVLALGDDNLIAVSEAFGEATCDELAVEQWEWTKIDWAGEKSFASYTLVDDFDEDLEEGLEGGPFEGVQFLGKYFKTLEISDEEQESLVVAPYRPVSETLCHMIYPERSPSKIAQFQFTPEQLTYMRVVGCLMDNPFNLGSWTFGNKLLDWLEEKGVHLWTKMDNRLAEKLWGDKDDEMREVIPLTRYRIDGMLDLYFATKEQVKGHYSQRMNTDLVEVDFEVVGD